MGEAVAAGHARPSKPTNAIRAEGQGIHRLEIFTLMEVVDVLAHVLVGDRSSTALLVASLAHQFMAMRETPQPALCFCCGRPVRRFAALVAITPHHFDQPTKAIGGAICLACDGTAQELRDRVIAAWRKEVDPSVRPIEIHPASGTA